MNVFVIDDAPVNVRTYEKILSAVENARIQTYTDPVVALRQCELGDPDLIVVDYRMPEMNGVEFITRFRTLPGKKEVPIVMLTAEREVSIRRSAIELGANDFLNKPADPIEFVARVRNLLALRDGQKQLSRRAEWLADEVQKATEMIVRREQETIHRLTRASEFRDNETGMHIVRMGRYSAILARSLGLSEDEQHLLQLASPMHDIGKVATPDHILLKRGKLNPDEWFIMQQHAVAGYEILRDSESPLLQRAAEIAFTHHEKWDGTGYPRHLAGNDIPVSGRICAVADVFDALTSKRPYKPAWPIEQALVHIHGARGTHFDPKVVDAFEDVVPEIRDVRTTLDDRFEVPA